MLLLRKRVHDKLANLLLWLDYIVYILLNPLKFKSFPKTISKILLVELYQLGDLLAATPTIAALKKLFPKAQLDVLVLSNTAQILEDNPDVDNVLMCTTFRETKKKLQQKRYDLGVILHPGSWKISILLFLAKVRYRVGCAKSGIAYGKGYLLNKKIKPNTKWQHKIEDNLDVIRALPIDRGVINAASRRPTLNLKPGIDSQVKKWFLGKKRPLIGIHVASSHKTQRWYPEKFAQVADELQQKHNATIIFTGTEQEKDQISEVLSRTREKNIVDLAGKTTFQEFAAVLKNLDVLVSIDTSALHVASAFNVPVVALFGPTIPMFWGPTSEKSKVIWNTNVCTGCRRYKCIIKTHECMKSITPKQVLNTLKEVLQ